MIADNDLLSMQYARILAENAKEAQKKLAAFPQEKLDAIVECVACEMEKHAHELAELSCEETEYGRVQDKEAKNLFVCRSVKEALRGMRCVGPLREDEAGRVLEVGVPLGVIAASVPSFLRNFRRAGVLKKRFSTMTEVPSGHPASWKTSFSIRPRA